MQNALLLSHIDAWDRMSLVILTALVSCVACGMSLRSCTSQITTQLHFLPQMLPAKLSSILVIK